MSWGFQEDLGQRLEALRAEGLLRRLRRVGSPPGVRVQVDGEWLWNFSSNDYLGLAGREELREAAAQAARDQGAGSAASRLICGSLAVHHELEEALAEFKGTEAALVFSSGYTAALGTIPALVGPGDVVVIDRLAHACLVDAARLSGARLRVFRHNDLESLAGILAWAARRAGEAGGRGRVLIVTETVFSMDGDQAPLPELVQMKDRYGAWLMVDEAHATGLYGQHGRGLAEACGVAQGIEVQMGTLGKALGAAGGYVCGTRTLVDYLVNRARSFVFSTAPVPAAAAAALAAVRLVGSDLGATLRERLWNNVAQLRSALAAPVLAAGQGNAGGDPASAIMPWKVGREEAAMARAERLCREGFWIPAVRYPTVPRGSARLRITMSAAHPGEAIASLGVALRGHGERAL